MHFKASAIIEDAADGGASAAVACQWNPQLSPEFDNGRLLCPLGKHTILQLPAGR